MNKEQSQNLEQGEETSLDFLLQVDEDKEHSAQLEAPQKRARHLPPQAAGSTSTNEDHRSLDTPSSSEESSPAEDFGLLVEEERTGRAKTPESPFLHLSCRPASSSSVPSDPSEDSDEMAPSVQQTRTVLEKHRYLIDDAEAAERGKVLIDYAREIVNRLRKSVMGNPESADVLDIVREYRDRNESTYLNFFWHALINRSREVPQDISGLLHQDCPTAGAQQRIGEWAEREFSKDGVSVNWNAPFETGCMPPLHSDDPLSISLFRDLPRVANPVPDLAYAYSKKTFTTDQRIIIGNLGCELTAKMSHCFFIVEAKSMNAPVTEAENQACRGGAAMVWNRRRFNAAAERARKKRPSAEPSPPNATVSAFDQSFPNPPEPLADDHWPRPDFNSFAFSFCFDATVANLFVHWAELCSAADITWHMSLLRCYNLSDREAYRHMRHDIDNILDWGASVRLTEIRAQIKDLEAVYENPKPTAKRRREATQEDGGDDDVRR